MAVSNQPSAVRKIDHKLTRAMNRTTTNIEGKVSAVGNCGIFRIGGIVCKSRIVADYTDDADYGIGDGGRW